MVALQYLQSFFPLGEGEEEENTKNSFEKGKTLSTPSFLIFFLAFFNVCGEGAGIMEFGRIMKIRNVCKFETLECERRRSRQSLFIQITPRVLAVCVCYRSKTLYASFCESSLAPHKNDKARYS